MVNLSPEVESSSFSFFGRYTPSGVGGFGGPFSAAADQPSVSQEYRKKQGERRKREEKTWAKRLPRTAIMENDGASVSFSLTFFCQKPFRLGFFYRGEHSNIQ